MLAAPAPPLPAPACADPATVMSPGDLAHWRIVCEWTRHARSGSEPARRRTVSLLVTGVRWLPGISTLDGVLSDLLGGLAGVGHRVGRVGLDPAGVLAAYRAAGHDVADLADLRSLEVDQLLAVRPALARAYATASAVQGGVCGVVAAIGALSCTGSGNLTGLAAALAAIGVDTVLTGAACARAVAHVAAYHGYDVARPDEAHIALAVLGVGIQEAAGRPAAYARLQALDPRTPRPAWVGRPAAGAPPGIDAVLSARLLTRVVDAADHLYRERFLREKYGLAPAAAA